LFGKISMVFFKPIFTIKMYVNFYSKIYIVKIINNSLLQRWPSGYAAGFGSKRPLVRSLLRLNFFWSIVWLFAVFKKWFLVYLSNFKWNFFYIHLKFWLIFTYDIHSCVGLNDERFFYNRSHWTWYYKSKIFFGKNVI
jgi:hypothetical protein